MSVEHEGSNIVIYIYMCIYNNLKAVVEITLAVGCGVYIPGGTGLDSH